MRLLRIELNKILYNRTVWIMFGLYVFLFALSALALDGIVNSMNVNSGDNSSIGKMLLGGMSVFSFPGIWHNMAYMASLFKILLAVIVITLVINEYNYRTLRQNIIDGMSKWEIIWAKELVILLLSLLSVFIYLATTLLFGKNFGNIGVVTGLEYTFAYFVTLFLYLNFAYFLSTWIKKSGLVITILLAYSLIIENVVTYYLPDQISDFLPMNVMGNMIPNPFRELVGLSASQDFLMINAGVCVVYTTLFIGLNQWMLKTGYAKK